ncbi:MAG: ATP-binding protein [Planctomycetota bacterium]
MKWLSPRNRIAMGLTGAVVAVICMARAFGLIPDRTTVETQSRAELTETIALSCSGIMINGDLPTLTSYLDGVVARNDGLLSSGVRDGGDRLMLEIGEHQEHWDLKQREKSSDSQMFVPIFSRANEKWGTVELRFKPLRKPGIQGILDSLGFGLIFFAGSSSFLVFNFILKLVLKHLDPSRAVPRRVRDALDNLAEGLMILDNRSNILLANNSLSIVLGKEPDELIGINSRKLDFLADENGNLPWFTALSEKRLVSNARVRLADTDKKERTFLANCSPLLGHNGGYCGVMVTFDDVTQLEESRTQLREARDAADAASQAKSDFLANMSHEIRTPMNAILGFTDVLRRGMEDNPDQRIEYLNTIHSSGNHLIELINDILDLSKVEAGKLELEIREFSLPMLLHETIHVLSARAKEKGISLNYEVVGSIPQNAESDSMRLRQVLINLIGNAIKFTEKGGVKLRCGFDNDTLEFHVIDSGIGMTDEQCSKIFEAFSQADTSVTRKFGGTGLGLSISKKFVEAMDGEIRAESKIGVGSNFIVRIPLVVSNPTQLLDQTGCLNLVKAQSKSSGSSKMRKLNTGTVLVVDDGETNRSIVSLVLRKHGIRVLEAANGQEAIQRIESEPTIDVVLMDMQMPVMDGYTATQLLRQGGSSLPIIALTGNAMQGDRQKCHDAGCTAFLQKPIQIDELVKLLGVHLGFSEEYLGSSNKRLPSQKEKKAAEPSAKPQTVPKLDAWTTTLPMDDEEFRKIVEKFVEDLPARVDQMTQMLHEQDFEGLKSQGHWLKGAAGTVGLGKLTAPAKQLEKSASENDMEACGSALKLILGLISVFAMPTTESKSAEAVCLV